MRKLCIGAEGMFQVKLNGQWQVVKFAQISTKLLLRLIKCINNFNVVFISFTS
jgi:hypothetical protein